MQRSWSRATSTRGTRQTPTPADRPSQRSGTRTRNTSTRWQASRVTIRSPLSSRGFTSRLPVTCSGFSTTESTPHHNVVRFSWELVPASGGDSVAIGFDVAVTEEDGRIRSVFGFLDKAPGA